MQVQRHLQFVSAKWLLKKTVSPRAQDKIIKNLEASGFSLASSDDEKLVVNIQALQ